VIDVAGRRCVRGIDISNHQNARGAINFDAVASAGFEFVVAKATEGTGYIDRYYTNNRDAAHRAGLVFGAYHWLRPNQDAAVQARAFLDVTESGAGCVFLTLDAEQSGITDHQVVTWCRTVAAATGIPIAIYCGAYTDPTARSDEWLAHTPWLAAYGPNRPGQDPNQMVRPVPPAPWGRWDIWQYTSVGSVPGVIGNCDVNVADARWFATLTNSGPQEDDMGAVEQAQLADIQMWIKDNIPTLRAESADTNRWVKLRNTTDPKAIEQAVREALVDFDVEIIVKPKG
jgi:GH25 family lysozyme M1 (1,4-beta-N-acetylmuramidase)